jgi:PleD family two-component response regulator
LRVRPDRRSKSILSDTLRARARRNDFRYDTYSEWLPASEQPLARILLVDDEEPIRGFAERILRDAGCDVVVASDGPETLMVVDAQRPFDLCVIDFLMPQMRGDELARQLQQRDPTQRWST